MNLRAFLQSNCINFDKKIYFFSEPKESSFSQLYLSVREKEHRLYDNSEVKILPNYIGIDSQLAHEWELRKLSSKMLKEYLLKFFPNANVLDVGCGNGWFSNFLSSETNNIYGLDVNFNELIQAGELFYKQNRVEFIFGDFFQIKFPENLFDVILFASSIQYFDDLHKIIEFCRKLLTPNGEIHILDTYFYKENEVESASLRSKDYYEKIGFPEMNNYYFHHSEKDLEFFKSVQLYNPTSKIKKFTIFTTKKELIPFPWFKILKT